MLLSAYLYGDPIFTNIICLHFERLMSVVRGFVSVAFYNIVSTNMHLASQFRIASRWICDSPRFRYIFENCFIVEILGLVYSV